MTVSSRSSRKSLSFAQQVVRELTDLALEDFTISHEEYELLEALREKVKILQERIDQAMEDNILTENDLQDLKQLTDQLFKDLSAIAAKDGTTHEEERMLSKLREILKRYPWYSDED